MSIYFRTPQRTLRNDDMTVDDMTDAVVGAGVVVGYDEKWREIQPSDPLAQATYYVSTRYISEWWNAPPLPKENTLGPPWALHSPHPSVVS